MRKTLFIELILLAGLAILAVIIAGYYAGFDAFTSGSANFNFHDTYLAGTPLQLTCLIFINLSFIVLGIRIIIRKFQNPLTNALFIIITGLLILKASQAIHFISIMNFGHSMSVTVYPPMSALINEKEKGIWSTSSLICMLISIQFILLLILVIVSFITGKQMQKMRK